VAKLYDTPYYHRDSVSPFQACILTLTRADVKCESANLARCKMWNWKVGKWTLHGSFKFFFSPGDQWCQSLLTSI